MSISFCILCLQYTIDDIQLQKNVTDQSANL